MENNMEITSRILGIVPTTYLLEGRQRVLVDHPTLGWLTCPKGYTVMSITVEDAREDGAIQVAPCQYETQAAVDEWEEGLAKRMFQ